MDLEEKYGDIKVLRVEVQEPEQMSFGGAAPSRPPRTASEPAAPPSAGQTPAAPDPALWTAATPVRTTAPARARTSGGRCNGACAPTAAGRCTVWWISAGHGRRSADGAAG